MREGKAWRWRGGARHASMYLPLRGGASHGMYLLVSCGCLGKTPASAKPLMARAPPGVTPVVGCNVVAL